MKNRYSVQFMEERWKVFSIALVTDDLNRAKKFCAAMVAYNPHVGQGRVIDFILPSPDGVVYSVGKEAAEGELKAMMEGGKMTKYKVMVKSAIRVVDEKELLEMLAAEIKAKSFVGLMIERSDKQGTVVIKREGG
jgi:hypothetical protein